MHELDKHVAALHRECSRKLSGKGAAPVSRLGLEVWNWFPARNSWAYAPIGQQPAPMAERSHPNLLESLIGSTRRAKSIIVVSEALIILARRPMLPAAA